MKVTIKSFDVAMQVKQKGVELEVKSPDGSEHHGDCFVTMSALIWCKGRKKKENGVKIRWEHLMEICKTKGTLKAALRAARDA